VVLALWVVEYRFSPLLWPMAYTTACTTVPWSACYFASTCQISSISVFIGPPRWCQCLQKVKIYQQTKFRRHISIRGWDITTSGLEKQTFAILEFYFRFRSLPFFVICVIFCIRLPNFVQIGTPIVEMWHIHFSSAQYYFWFHICWCHCLQKAVTSTNQQTKFCRHMSIYDWDITTSGLEKQTSAILEFYFRFRSRPFRRKCRVILHDDAEFHQNQTMHYRIMRCYRFLRWWQSAMLYLLWGNSRPPTKFLSWSELGLQIASLSD